MESYQFEGGDTRRSSVIPNTLSGLCSGRFGKVACSVTALLTLSQMPSAAPIDTAKGAEVTSCVNPDQDDIKEVEALFDSPEDTYRKERTERGWEEQAASDFSGDYTQQAIIDINDYAAKKFGLRTFNYLKYSRKLSDDIYLDTEEITSGVKGAPLPFEEYLEAAVDFARNYGVEIIVDEPYGFEYAGQTPTESQLNTYEAKISMFNLIQSMGVLPVELIELANLKRIRLMYSDDPSNIGGYAETTTSDTYVINVKFPLEQTVFNHELYHLIDLQACGGNLVRDPAFRELNGNDEVYIEDGIEPEETTSLDDVSRFYDDNYAALNEAHDNGNTEAYCRIIRTASTLTRNSLTSSDYALTNPAEDKAELMKGVFNTLQEGSPIPSKTTPKIYKKTMYLLGRLYKSNPNLVKFFATVNGRPEKPQKAEIEC